MSARYRPWIAIGGGGAAWAVHLFAGYFLVALGCPREWPLGGMLTVVTVLAAGVALAIGMLSARGWWRAPARDGDDDGASALLYGAAAMLAGLFTVAILLGGITALMVSPCRSVAIG
jgi:hypothetical protein